MLHRGGEIVGAVVVVALGAEALIAIDVASGERGVVHAGRTVLEQGQDRAPPVRDHAVAHARRGAAELDPAMLHRHELARVRQAKGPAIHDLAAVGVDHLDALAGGEPVVGAPTGWNHLQGGHRSFSRIHFSRKPRPIASSGSSVKLARPV